MTDAYVDWETVARFVNPVEQRMMAMIVAAESPSGLDRFCMNDLKAFGRGFWKDKRFENSGQQPEVKNHCNSHF